MLIGTQTLRGSFVAFTLLLALGTPLFSQAQQPQLGSLDGEGLPPTDIDRVRVGQVAPDFRLVDEQGTIHQLSQYRGKKNIVLVVYRGYW
jgi:cytochrome oxidase Cu insertion factor (SCO1/SenC/PrrC family)